jgi:predicted RNA-binding Zn-ribbon protein involved in translation (DUF1610 family)
MNIRRLRTYDGEIIEIRELAERVFACPVCGFVLGNNPPYAEGYGETPDGRRSPTMAIGSQDICPNCGTQFGYTDSDEGIPLVEQWNRLRQRWLALVADKNNAREQLKNIGIELPAHGET